MFTLVLAWEARDHVGGHRHTRQRLPDAFEHSQVRCGRVRAPHTPQHAVTPRLQRDVQVAAERRRLGGGGKQTLVHVARFDA